jgi:A/G-specific adenine glycosylase
MLQQTQVATVIPYYRRFLARFPTMEQLASAAQLEVLKAWEGLGYYARARNLHRAAREMVVRFGGQVPSTFDDLHALPGIGRSTAGAILTIALGQRHPILDGNVRRVLCRYFCVEEDPRGRKTENRLWQYAEGLLPQKEAGLYTHALMDLGATLCLPAAPQCSRCPVQAGCMGHRRGMQAELPRRSVTKSIPHRDYAAGAIFCNEQLLIHRRPEGGLLGGLWELPGGQVTTGDVGAQLTQMLRPHLRGRIRHWREGGALNHTFTHFKMTLHLFLGQVDKMPNTVDPAYCWTPLAKLSDYPFSSAHRKAVTRLNGLGWAGGGLRL